MVVMIGLFATGSPAHAAELAPDWTLKSAEGETTPGVILVGQGLQIRFDLRSLPPRDPPNNGTKSSRKIKAAFLAPYWAAELRKSIDTALQRSK